MGVFAEEPVGEGVVAWWSPSGGVFLIHVCNIFFLNLLGLIFLYSLNEWDKGDKVVLIATNSYLVEHILESTYLVHSTVEKVCINLTKEIVSRKPLSSIFFYFGVINCRFLARKNIYAYMSIGAPMPKFCGVTKLDFDKTKGASTMDCVVSSRLYGKGCFISDPFFISRTSYLKARGR